MDGLPMKRVLFAAAGTLFAALSAFFTYYSVRLTYINLAVSSVAAHRQTGMYIGAVVFPVAAAGFGWISWKCWKRWKRY
jgi:hypothetical protein